jgi:hypothetical protein
MLQHQIHFSLHSMLPTQDPSFLYLVLPTLNTLLETRFVCFVLPTQYEQNRQTYSPCVTITTDTLTAGCTICYITQCKPVMDCLEPEQTGGRWFRDDRITRTDGGVCQNLCLFKILDLSLFLEYHRQLQADVTATAWIFPKISFIHGI